MVCQCGFFLIAKARNELSAKTTVKMIGIKLNDFAMY